METFVEVNGYREVFFNCGAWFDLQDINGKMFQHYKIKVNADSKFGKVTCVLYELFNNGSEKTHRIDVDQKNDRYIDTIKFSISKETVCLFVTIENDMYSSLYEDFCDAKAELLPSLPKTIEYIDNKTFGESSSDDL